MRTIPQLQNCPAPIAGLPSQCMIANPHFNAALPCFKSGAAIVRLSNGRYLQAMEALQKGTPCVAWWTIRLRPQWCAA